MTRGDTDGLAFGGIWTGMDTAGAILAQGSLRLLTVSVLTLPAEGDLALVHDRMPLVLEPSRWHAWLTSAEPSGLLAGPPPQYAAGIELRPVSPAVGDVRNDGPELIRKVTPPLLNRSTMEPPDALF